MELDRPDTYQGSPNSHTNHTRACWNTSQHEHQGPRAPGSCNLFLLLIVGSATSTPPVYGCPNGETEESTEGAAQATRVNALAPFTKPLGSLVLSNHIYRALQLLPPTPAHPS